MLVGGAGLFRARPEVNLKGAAHSVIILCRALCFAPAAKSAFFL